MNEEVKKEEVPSQENEAKTGKGEKSHSGKKGKRKPGMVEQELTQVQEKLADLNDKYIRLYSEFDNYRKRTIKEKGELIKTASEEVILSLLPILDDMERAISVMEAAAKEGDSSLLEGIRLIYNKLSGTLQQKGLQAMESKGQDFNVDYHEAITNIPAPGEDMKGKVVDEIQKGYMLNGKVIRFARVVVGA
jgi:molecular chaperone GrpE